MTRSFTLPGGAEFRRLDDAPEHDPEFDIIVQAKGQARNSARVDLASLASAIAAMTPLGDTAETFAAAERFLKTGTFLKAG